MSEGIVRSLGSGRFLDWRALNAEGAAGGILICWDKRVLEILDWEEGQFSLSCRFKTIENGATWVFTGVYGPFTKVEREGMWEELGAIRGLWDDPWCLGGDFNITLFQHERSSQRRTSSAMRRFAEFVDDLELVDLPLQGGEFTWSGGLNNQAWARLDRFLVSPSWLDQFSGVTQGRTWWQGIEVRGSASYRLAVKMKEIKKKLKVWNKEVFGRLETNKALALHQVDFWDRVESERVLSMEEAELKKEAKDSFKKWVLLEEAHWRQHSRELWLKDGDKNTGFFHRMASAHRRHNAMDRIKVNGEWLVEEQEVREGVVNSFQQLLTEDMGWQADIGSIPVGCISLQDAESLETPFAENEIHSALMEMNGDKAPGPDGFTVAFWQDAWDFAKEEIMEMFKEFHEHSSFVKSLNNTFLVLIPKKSGAENLGDFRPISLVGGLYKLLAKVLANRLKKVIGKVVSIAQNAFVKGRQILDASLIANEVIDSWQKRKEKGLICKLDIEKAYDSINWKFLMKVLQKMGFGPKWMGWMWSCVSSAKFSILVNGVPAGFFPSTRGLRQGDPLSPYLFVMGMEVLDVLIRRAVEGGYISGCNIRGGSRTSLNISHLFFADDTIVFCEASKEQVSHLSWILFWFEAASGLRINLAKSEIIPVGDVEDILELAAELGGRVGSLPSHYLGLPLGVPNRATSMWDGVEERIRRRLAFGKTSVAKRVEKTQRDFLWGGGNLEGKVHLVKWDAVCTEKHKGGLGLRRIATLNRALLGKWIWRFACEKNNFWNQVITTKYGQEDYGWRPKKGSKIKFWKDRWCTDIPLSQRFNQLFVLAVHRDATIEEMWDQDSGQGDWKLVFVRDFNDWEMDMVGELLHTLRGYRPSLEDDSVVWKQGRNGIFKIKEAYRQLDKPNVTVFPARRIWVDRVPTKVCFFAWEATWGKVLTLDRLQLRGVHLPNCCFLCGCEEENGRKGKGFGNPFRYVFFGRFGGRGIGIRVQSLKKGQIIMDIDLRWGGDPSIILAVEAALVASIPIQLKDLQVFTVARVIFQLAEEIPCISAVIVALLSECLGFSGQTHHWSISAMVAKTPSKVKLFHLVWNCIWLFHGKVVKTKQHFFSTSCSGIVLELTNTRLFNQPKPRIDYTLKAVGGSLTALPGISDMIDDTVNTIITDMLQWPHRIVVPIGGMPVDTSELELKPQGKLTLTIVKANDLKNMEMIGKSDPYVVVHIRPLFKIKTKVIENNLNPVWNQTFELIAEDKETQSLILEVLIPKTLSFLSCCFPGLVLVLQAKRVGTVANEVSNVHGPFKQVIDKDITQDKRLGIAKLPLNDLEAENPKEIELRLLPSLDMLKIKDKKDRGTITIKVLYHAFNKEEQMAALEEEKRILEERKKLKEAGVIGSTMDALDGAASLVGSGIGLVGSGVGAGVGLVGTGLGAGVGIVGSGLGAVGSGLSKAGKFMGRSITGQSSSNKRNGSTTPVNNTQENGGVKPT
ncbi:LINE-1 reverse transcriptase-like [Vitis vinifera]|uniref:LINE-1 reverse transcriptase-like n=1 Tax=Vitis vinifera TaxID=29760 RepID=A0A438IW69_VITVI|nr:LINE-1 reverse transcriptase-like [Vitis vinifera]